jgi:hypothetical protein
VNILDFSHLDIDICLRLLLMKFRLPGEAQKIDRVTEKFAEHYWEQNKDKLFKQKDAVYLLAFAIIMLNTAEHNPQVKVKMGKEGFVNQTKYIVNGTVGIPQEFCEELYDRILGDRIVPFEFTLYPRSIRRSWLYLLVKSGPKQSWRKCWFILEKGVLYCFNKAGVSLRILSALANARARSGQNSDVLAETRRRCCCRAQ